MLGISEDAGDAHWDCLGWPCGRRGRECRQTFCGFEVAVMELLLVIVRMAVKL